MAVTWVYVQAGKLSHLETENKGHPHTLPGAGAGAGTGEGWEGLSPLSQVPILSHRRDNWQSDGPGVMRGNQDGTNPCPHGIFLFAGS